MPHLTSFFILLARIRDISRVSFYIIFVFLSEQCHTAPLPHDLDVQANHLAEIAALRLEIKQLRTAPPHPPR